MYLCPHFSYSLYTSTKDLQFQYIVKIYTLLIIEGLLLLHLVQLVLCTQKVTSATYLDEIVETHTYVRAVG